MTEKTYLLIASIGPDQGHNYPEPAIAVRVVAGGKSDIVHINAESVRAAAEACIKCHRSEADLNAGVNHIFKLDDVRGAK